MKKVKEFLTNLTEVDIDLIDKLNNMYGCEICNDVVWNILFNNKELQEQVECCLRDIVKKDLLYWGRLVKEETEYLYDVECIDDKEDYSSGLYNLDSLYLDSINRALSLGYDITIY